MCQRPCCPLLPRLTRARAWALYLPLLLVFVALNQYPLLGFILTELTVILFAVFAWRLRLFVEPPDAQGDVEALLQRAGAGGGGGGPAPASRVAYLDAVKAILAVVVILHHTIGAFAGGGSLGLSVGNFRNALQPVFSAVQTLNQAYFMSLFFFISAFFAPGSVARKGAAGFLKDRATRLGAPFLPFLLLLGPALMFLVQWAQGAGTWAYIPYAGPLWFVCWLGIFCYFYGMVAEDGGAGAFVRCELPGPCALLGVGLGLGVLQGVQMVGASAFPLMPIAWGSLPFDVAFFYAGVLAKRNGWLDAPLPRRLVLSARAYAALFIAATFAGYFCLHAVGGGGFLLSANACGAAVDRSGKVGDGVGIGIVMAVATASGPYTIFMSIAVLDVARWALEGRSLPPWLKFLSDNAYAAYIFHPVVVFPATAGFIAIIRRQGLPMVWAGGSADSASCVAEGSQEPALLAGFLAVTAVSLLGTYVLTALVRKIPGAGKVL